VVGEGPERDINWLRRVAQHHGVGERVDFVGYLANPFALIGRSDVYVCASRWEGSCNALLEALACGVPVVATDCPTGNSEILFEGRLGTLSPPESPAELARAIRKELEQRRDVAARASHLVRFDLQQCMDEWIQLLSREHGVAGSAVTQPLST